MARSRTSSLWLLLWGGLLFQSFRPIGGVERALDVLLAPLRFVAELGSPFGLLRARGVAAAERALARDVRTEAEAGAEALALLAARALPRDPALRAGRHFVPGEVVARPNKDECWVAVRALTGIEVGAPVVCGDAFVGRVTELGPPPGKGAGEAPARVRVQLVTAGSFRVGAEVRGADSEEPVYLTVGGVEVPRVRGARRSVRLAAHQPSSSALARGVARVRELFADADAAAELAEGFRLGEVRREGERELPWVEPELDYLDGLFQVAIVVRAALADPASTRIVSALEDGRWLGTRALTHGDPAPWRSTLKLPLGRADGIVAGAAVIGAGARLVGRVIRAGTATSDVALLSDPGFTLAAIARVDAPEGGAAESAEDPRILGRLATLGRGSDGTLRLRWWVRVPFGADAARDLLVPARLYSGSGDPGLPAGLYLGRALLPAAVRAGEEHDIELDPGIEPSDVRTLFVRRAAAEQGP